MRTPGCDSLIDVLERVLDRGLVIDQWVRTNLAGIDPDDPDGSPPPSAAQQRHPSAPSVVRAIAGARTV